MNKIWSLIAMAAALLGAVSCTPVGAPNQGPGGLPLLRQASASPVPRVTSAGETGGVASGARPTSSELRQLREQRARVGGARGGGEQVINSGGGRTAGGGGAPSAVGSGGGDDYNSNLPTLNVDYPYGIPVPGRPGWVFNAYTNRPVDARGVESGRLIYDERDPQNRNPDGTLKPVAEMPNKFRVP